MDLLEIKFDKNSRSSFANLPFDPATGVTLFPLKSFHFLQVNLCNFQNLKGTFSNWKLFNEKLQN